MTNSVEGLDPTRSELVARVEKETGPSNFYRVMARHAQGVMEFRNLESVVMAPGTVDRRIKELAYLAVSVVNECAYCVHHREHACLAVGISPAAVHGVKTENDMDFDPRERAALRYARELTRNCIAEDDTTHILNQNFSQEQTVELTEVICLANFTNRFNNGLQVGLE